MLGAGTSVGIGVESTWGTAVTPTNFRRPISANPRRGYGLVPTGTIGTSFYTKDVEGFETADAACVLEVTYENFGMWYDAMLWGTVSTSGPSGTQYTHTHNQGTAAPVGHTVQTVQGDTGNSLDLEGGLVNTWELSMSVAQQHLQLTLGWLGEALTVNASPTSASYGSGDEIVSAIDGADLSWDSATYCLRSLRIRGDNGLERRNCIGKSTTEKPQQVRARTVTVELELDYVASIETKHAARTEGNASITFTGSGDNELTLLMRNFQITELDEPINNQGVITQRIRGRCRENPSGTYPFQITAKNANSSGTAN